MPGTTPPTSQLDWLSSTTAMIVLFWSRATRDLLKSFGWGIAATPSVRCSDEVATFPRRPPHSIFRFRARRNQEISVSRWSSTDLVYGTVVRISAEPSGRHAREQYRADKCPVDGERPSREGARGCAEGPRSRQRPRGWR